MRNKSFLTFLGILFLLNIVLISQIFNANRQLSDITESVTPVPVSGSTASDSSVEP